VQLYLHSSIRIHGSVKRKNRDFTFVVVIVVVVVVVVIIIIIIFHAAL